MNIGFVIGSKKSVAIWIIVCFLITQVIPSGFAKTWSEVHPEDFQAGQEPTKKISNTLTPEPLPIEKIPSGTWMPKGPLSPVENKIENGTNPLSKSGGSVSERELSLSQRHIVIVQRAKPPGSTSVSLSGLETPATRNADVKDVFKSILGREASEEEQKYFQNQIAAGKTMEEIQKSLEAARKAIDDLATSLNLSSNQRNSIRIQEASLGSWGGCWEGCKGLFTAQHVILKLFENTYEYRANILKPEHQNAIQAMKELLSRGVALEDIRIDSSEIPFDLEGGGYYHHNGNVQLSSKEGQVWIYQVKDGRLFLAEERSSNQIIWHYADGSKTTVIYDSPERKTPVTMIYQAADGRKVTVDLMRVNPREWQGRLDLKAIEAALKDLLNQANDLETAMLVLRNYEKTMGLCTADIPISSCSETLKLDFESSTTVYHYEVEHSWSQRTSRNEYSAKFIFKEPREADDIRQAKKVVITTLVDLFRFTKEQIAEWIRMGLLKIEVDLQTLKVTVSFDSAIKPASGFNPLDPLGDGSLPSSIEFQLENDMDNDIDLAMPPYEIHMAVVAARFQKGDHRYEVDFVKIQATKCSGFACIGFLRRHVPYHIEKIRIYGKEGELISTTTYEYFRVIQEKDGQTFDSWNGEIRAVITYATPLNGIAIREVTFSWMEDKQYHIQSIVDKDAGNKVLATSVFSYSVSYSIPECVPGAKCSDRTAVVTLQSVSRKDANGNLLSEIKIPAAGTAEITLPDGTKQEVTFKDFEELLDQARALEKDHLAMQEYVNTLRQKLGDGFSVTVERREDGTYWVSVLDIKVYETPPTTGMHEMKFSLRTETTCNSVQCYTHYTANPENSLQVSYYSPNGDITVENENARLLFEAMGRCPKDEICLEWVPTTEDKLLKMTQITVTSVDPAGRIHLSMDGNNYKAYRDADGKVVLEEDRPPEEVEIEVFIIDPVTGQTISRKLRLDLSRDSGNVLENGRVMGTFLKTRFSARIAGVYGALEIRWEGTDQCYYFFMDENGTPITQPPMMMEKIEQLALVDTWSEMPWADVKVIARAMDWYAHYFAKPIPGDNRYVYAVMNFRARYALAMITLQHWEFPEMKQIVPNLEYLFDFLAEDILLGLPESEMKLYFVTEYFNFADQILNLGMDQYSNGRLGPELIQALERKIISQPGLIEGLNQTFGPWTYFRASMISAANRVGRFDEMARALNLTAAQCELFKTYGILAQGTSDPVLSDEEVRWIENHLALFPKNLFSRLRSIIVGEDMGRGGFYVNHNGFGYVGMARITEPFSYGWCHELWHYVTMAVNLPDLLPEKRWIANRLFDIGFRWDRTGDYGSLNVLENLAQFGALMMQNTVSCWNEWARRAREGSPIGLRTLLLLMEILANSSDGKVPLYQNGIGITGYAPITLDAQKNITSIEFPSEGIRYRFTYSADGLLLETMVIENISTGESETIRFMAEMDGLFQEIMGRAPELADRKALQSLIQDGADVPLIREVLRAAKRDMENAALYFHEGTVTYKQFQIKSAQRLSDGTGFVFQYEFLHDEIGNNYPTWNYAFEYRNGEITAESKAVMLAIQHVLPPQVDLWHSFQVITVQSTVEGKYQIRIVHETPDDVWDRVYEVDPVTGEVILEPSGEAEIEVSIIDPATGIFSGRKIKFDLQDPSRKVYEGDREIGTFEIFESNLAGNLSRYLVIRETSRDFIHLALIEGESIHRGSLISARTRDFSEASDLKNFMALLAKVLFSPSSLTEEDYQHFETHIYGRRDPGGSMDQDARFQWSFTMVYSVERIFLRALQDPLLFKNLDLARTAWILYHASNVQPFSKEQAQEIYNTFQALLQCTDGEISLHTKVGLITAAVQFAYSDRTDPETIGGLYALATLVLKHQEEASDEVYGDLLRTFSDMEFPLQGVSQEILQAFLKALEPVMERSESFKARAYANALYYGLIMDPWVEVADRGLKIQRAFDLLRDPELFASSNSLTFVIYANMLMRGILHHTFYLTDDDPIRSQIVEAFKRIHEEVPDLRSKMFASFSEASQLSWLNHFSSIGLVAKKAEDRNKVIESLRLSGGRADIFRDYGILVLGTNVDFTEADIAEVKKWLSNYPKPLIGILGLVQRYDGHSSSNGFVNAPTRMIYGISMSSAAGKLTFDHELAHAFLDYSNDPRILPEKEWIRQRLYYLGTYGDRSSDYGNTNARENIADFGRYLMLDTQAEILKWVEKAKAGRFLGLRTLLAVLEIHVMNWGENKMPLYSGDLPSFVSAQTDAQHNITMFELDGKRYHFTYTSDSLHIMTMTIENIQTGEKQIYENEDINNDPQWISFRGLVYERIYRELGNREVSNKEFQAFKELYEKGLSLEELERTVDSYILSVKDIVSRLHTDQTGENDIFNLFECGLVSIELSTGGDPLFRLELGASIFEYRNGQPTLQTQVAIAAWNDSYWRFPEGINRYGYRVTTTENLRDSVYQIKMQSTSDYYRFELIYEIDAVTGSILSFRKIPS